MPRLMVATALVAMLGIPARVAAQATDYSAVLGSWEMTQETPRGTMTQVFTFSVDQGQLKGTVTSDRGGTVDLKNVAYTNGRLTFDVERTFGERSMTQNYSATIQGNTMSGTVSGGRGDRDFTAQKKQG